MRTQGYVLGVDLGTTFTAAAVARPGEPAVGVPLGSRSAATPTVAYLGEDGEFLVGEAALRRAVTDPDRVVREFKRRIGDETPLLLGDSGDRINAHRLAALVVAWVVNTVSTRQGERPSSVVVTHPAAWGAHKQQLLRGALADVGVRDVLLVTEPHAAAVAYAQTHDLEPGSRLAVYDLGGGTFDASVLRVEASGEFTAQGRPIGLPDLGGIDFDDAVLAHVVDALGDAVAALDPGDPVVAAALARLRQECVEAKEALSADTATTVPVVLGGVQTNLRLTRSEFQVMIEPAVNRTLEALDAALAEADLGSGNLDHLLLTGGSARIPFITQVLSAHLGPNVSLGRDLDPKLAVALGAALVGRRALEPVAAPPPAEADAEITVERPALLPTQSSPTAPPRPVAALPELTTAPAGRTSRGRILVGAGALALTGVVGAAMVGGIGLPELGGTRNASEPVQAPGTHLQEERTKTSTEPAETPLGTAAVQPAPQAPAARQAAPVYRRAPATLGSVRRGTPARPAEPRLVKAQGKRVATPQRPAEPAAAPATVEAAPAAPVAPAPAPAAPVQPPVQNPAPAAPQAEDTATGGTSLQNAPAAPAPAPPAPRARGFAPTAPPSAP
ncbi:MAG: Hsp70 family protein [Sporichthyaceae bacterium]